MPGTDNWDLWRFGTAWCGVNRNLTRIFDALLSGSPTEWTVFLSAFALIAFAIWAVSRYRASLRGDADPAAEDAVLVRRIRELRDSGEVSETEYRSLRSRLQPLAGDTSASGANAVRQQSSPSPRPGTEPDRATSQASSDERKEGFDPNTLTGR
jgi:hypothetical protein